MEIERRWLVEGWPALTPSAVLQMDQGYFAVRPAIRIRREAVLGGETRYVLCFKGGAGLAREEVEVDVDEEFDTEAAALAWTPPEALTAYLSHEVTGQPGESMAAYWSRTRRT